MRQLHLFIVGEKTLPRAGVPRSSLLSCRLGFSGLEMERLIRAVAREEKRQSIRAAAQEKKRRFERRAATQGLRSQCKVRASRVDGGWGGAGRRSRRRPAALFVTRAAARDSKRPYRISVNQVLKRAWKRYGIDGKGFSLGGQSPPMTSRGTTSSRSSASSSSLDIEVALILCEMKNQLQSCSMELEA